MVRMLNADSASKWGDDVIMQNGAWPIVGAFSGTGVLGSELMGDADTIATMTRRQGFGSVQVRLQSHERFAAFRTWLTTNPALAVAVETQDHYYSKVAAGFISILHRDRLSRGHSHVYRRALRLGEHAVRGCRSAYL